MDHTKHINYCLKVTLLHFEMKFEDLKVILLHFEMKFEDRLPNSIISFVLQDFRPNGSFAVLPNPNMKYRYQCSLDQQRLQKYLPILNSLPKMPKKNLIEQRK